METTHKPTETPCPVCGTLLLLVTEPDEKPNGAIVGYLFWECPGCAREFEPRYAPEGMLVDVASAFPPTDHEPAPPFASKPLWFLRLSLFGVRALKVITWPMRKALEAFDRATGHRFA